MNMQKLGTVSRSLKIWALHWKPITAGLCGETPYTLCEVRKAETPERFAKRLASPNENLVRFYL